MHIMIDIETLGVLPSAKLMQIGAVEFDVLSGNLGREFFVHVNEESQPSRTTSLATLTWWARNIDKWDVEAMRNAVDLPEALGGLAEWVKQIDPLELTAVWANSPNFDLVILQHAFDQYNMRVPWGYGQMRDVRTLAHLAYPTITPECVARVGQEHNALSDARHQAQYSVLMYQTLKSGLIGIPP